MAAHSMGLVSIEIEKVPFHIHRGPLLEMLEAFRTPTLSGFLERGGYHPIRPLLERGGGHLAIRRLEDAGLRGRAGGGFPTGHKWWLVAQKEVETKFLVCNANTGQAGDFKTRTLLSTSPHLVIEAMMHAALAAGVTEAFLCLPSELMAEAELLKAAVSQARAAGYLGPGIFQTDRALEIHVVRTAGRFLDGEETALLEQLEGRPGQPRRQPARPTRAGLFGKPTIVNNLETLLQAALINREGAAAFRALGSQDAPGTMVFCLSGDIVRPGLYELPLGTPLRTLIEEHGGGPEDGVRLRGIHPGGVSSPVLTAEMFDVSLDFEALRAVGSDIGSGTVIAFSDAHDTVQLTTRLAEVFQDASCGKCAPCFDGTRRVVTMLYNLDRLDEKSIDVASAVESPKSMRSVNRSSDMPVRGVSYTDMSKGLTKIDDFCEFFKYRGDCRFSRAAGEVVQRNLQAFRADFEAYGHHEPRIEGLEFLERRPIAAQTEPGELRE
ncbi:SLBB domain-containing protein [Sulfidibacter corallicola]|uniref:SLBB domain-containing protein n=1 Tax=Sulfidibacter corallicola TaxID=2818388 RepID=A0A8A4TT55_SULCO|nr:NADH-ubiquinone oxidoreductase-F iron-sulfur binding region domain-containing protein [Sulfidibacter corallicola]QTD52567.1 SLBB domain-containing protein [Sulfidibacter corallicola]